MRRVTAKKQPRYELKSPRTLVGLPNILEDTQFMPLLDPLVEQPFEVEHTPEETQCMTLLDPPTERPNAPACTGTTLNEDQATD